MQIELSPEDEAFLREWASSYGFQGLERPLAYAIFLLRKDVKSQREAPDFEMTSEDLEAIEEGEEDVRAGRTVPIDDTFFERLRAEVRTAEARERERHAG